MFLGPACGTIQGSSLTAEPTNRRNHQCHSRRLGFENPDHRLPKLRDPFARRRNTRRIRLADPEALAGYLPAVTDADLYELLADYPQRAGKMMRPSICIATARAFGAERGRRSRSAVAIELLHNAMLVHDDIQDGSAMRRGAPTLQRCTAYRWRSTPETRCSSSACGRCWTTSDLSAACSACDPARNGADGLGSLEGQAIELGWNGKTCSNWRRPIT